MRVDQPRHQATHSNHVLSARLWLHVTLDLAQGPAKAGTKRINEARDARECQAARHALQRCQQQPCSRVASCQGSGCGGLRRGGGWGWLCGKAVGGGGRLGGSMCRGAQRQLLFLLLLLRLLPLLMLLGRLWLSWLLLLLVLLLARL